MIEQLAKIEYETTDQSFEEIKSKYDINKSLDELGWTKHEVFPSIVEPEISAPQANPTISSEDKISYIKDRILEFVKDSLVNAEDLSVKDVKELTSIVNMIEKGSEDNSSQVTVFVQNLITKFKDDV